LYETATPRFPSSAAFAQYVLPHAVVRPPLAAFEETVAGKTRYCFVTPYVTPLSSQPEQAQLLKWGVDLAHGLEFLHQNRLTFAGRITPACFGFVDDKIVWAGFGECHLVPELDPAHRRGDVVALAAQLWQWLTGTPQFAPTPSLPSALNEVFAQALTATKFETGTQLAEALHQTQEQLAAHKSVDYRLGQRTDVGRARTLNEDSLFAVQLHKNQQSLSQPMGIYVVADGMGGHARGEVASGTITNLIAENFSTLLTTPATPDTGQRWLEDAISNANRALYDTRRSSGSDMGSTLVMAVLVGNTACVGHVGDSRAYLINGQEITRLTADHSLVERLVATGQITPAEARHHPQSNVIYRVMGDKPRVESDPSRHLLRPGDRLLLCSDGLSGMVEDTLIHQIVINAVSPQDACDKLVEAANQAGGDDNISVIVIEIVEA
jgi:protein phosphatase